ncbi:sensor domain-containing diguanylate cyclase [Desulfosarcina cetonica]|uniref:sensor domain-containing diguanylate cyclase n=1 Tax=Desulfosarcina cetonica TaxID=90730 RepID=UPI0006D1FD84|nr:sensor domain-containing diguanylate cyclase [Desulfosarcina cetonica]
MHQRFRFLGPLALLLLTGFVSTSLVSYHVARGSLSKQIKESTLPLTSDNIYSEIQQDLLRPIFIASLMAQDTFLRDWAISGESDPQAMIRYLKEIQTRYGAETAFFVSEKTHLYYHLSGVLKQVRETDPQDRWYFRVRQLDTDYEINVDTDTANRQAMVVFINYRVYDYDGQFIGATGVGLAVKAVSARMASYQDRYDRRVFFVDPNGVVTLHSPNYQAPDNIHDTPGLSALVPSIFSSTTRSLTYSVDGRSIYLNSRWVPEFGWYLIVEQVENPAERRIRNTLLLNLFVSLMVTVIVLGLAHLTLGNYQRRIEKMATTDKLTGLANRYTLEILFGQSLKYVRRHKTGLCLIMFDIDGFKKVNDTYGHAAGDQVLKAVARAARSQIRESDILCRWGGEEFLTLLPDCDRDQARVVAEKMRQAIETQATIFWGDASIATSASFGVAQRVDGDDLEALVSRVDGALYNAKQKGRNRVEVVP